jgi:very-short-patch-repair endonuclease
VTSDLEAAFDTWLRRLAPDLPPATPEHRFAPPRRWRFDRAYPDRKLAIELEGGVWSGGRHTRPAGFEADCDKYNCATVEGWRVLRFTAKMLDSDPAACVALVVEAYATEVTRCS